MEDPVTKVKLRGVKIEDNVIVRAEDGKENEEESFDVEVLQKVTAIGDGCFGFDEESFTREIGLFHGVERAFFRNHQVQVLCDPSILDLSRLVNCKQIGDYFAVGHYGPVILPPALTSVGKYFVFGSRCRVLNLPDSLERIGTKSFQLVTADRIVIPGSVECISSGCCCEAQVANLEIPGSVKKIETPFCQGATIGTLDFAESIEDLDFPSPLLKEVTVDTLNLERTVRLFSKVQRSAISASAKINHFRHTLPTLLWDPSVDFENTLRRDGLSVKSSVLLGNPHNARFFSDCAVTIKKCDMDIGGSPIEIPVVPEVPVVAPALTRSYIDASTRALSAAPPRFIRPPRPPRQALEHIDLKTLEVFEDSYLGLVQEGDTIDMRSLEKCHTLGQGVFTDLTGVSTLLFPPNLSEIRDAFMTMANLPRLDVVFPRSVTKIEPGAFNGATVRSINSAECENMTSFASIPFYKKPYYMTLFSHFIGCCLHGATVDKIVFPPNLQTVGFSFMNGVNSPQLDLVFPPSMQWVPNLSHITVRSVDLSRAVNVPDLQWAMIQSLEFPPNVTTVPSGFLFGAVSPNLKLVFPSSLSTVGANMLVNSTIFSADFSNCDSLLSTDVGFLQNAAMKSLSLPPHLRVLGKSALCGIRGEELTITFPASLQELQTDVLKSANVKSVDMSAATSVSHIPQGFCEGANVATTVEIPAAIARLDSGAFSDFTCARFQFDASPSLELIEDRVFHNATIATVTILNCPKLRRVGDSFLAAAKLETPASLAFTDCMESVGSSFCAGTELRRLDLRQCDKIVDLPDRFLFKTDCSASAEASNEVVCLPSKVNRVGNYCLASSRGISSVELRSVLAVGSYFAADSDIDILTWPGRPVTVEHSFCKDVKILKIVGASCFYKVGDDFCRGVSKLAIDFSESAVLGTVGTGFLQGTTLSLETTAVNLSRCHFSECPERFMYRVCFERGGKLMLPSTVALIGAQCCTETAQLEHVSVAESKSGSTPFLEIGSDFLRGCVSLKSVALPATVISFGGRCLQDCPQLTITLSLPTVSRIGDDFCAQNESTMSGKDHAPDQEMSSSVAAKLGRATVSLYNVCPRVVIGDNFLLGAKCERFDFGLTNEATVNCAAAERDVLLTELEAALSDQAACGLSSGAMILKELITLRKMTLRKMAIVLPTFRCISKEYGTEKSDRMEGARQKELQLEEDTFFRQYTTHDYKWAQGALSSAKFRELLEELKKKHSISDEVHRRQADFTSTPESSKTLLSIGDNFLAGTTLLKTLDMTRAMHTVIGNRFAANSECQEVHLPPNVTMIGKKMCDGCLARVATAPQSQSPTACYLASWMGTPAEKERIDTLVHFRELLPASEQCGMARWLLEQKRFAEFKGAFNIRDDVTNLRYVGGAVDDLPDIPGDVPACFGFDMKVSHHDTNLSLLHWAVKYSRQFAHLLSEVSWSLRDLTLVTEQGFTALHYAVLYDIEAASLSTLLSIAAKAEIHRTWVDAWAAGGVRVSPLHLAYLYRRDAIVKELLAFEWDPTEAIKPAGGPVPFLDAFDQSVMALGQARATAALHDSEDDLISGAGVRTPVPVQLFHASVLLCVCRNLEVGVHDSHKTDEGIRQAFVTLRHRLSIDFALLSPNKWPEARDEQVALAEWGSGIPQQSVIQRLAKEKDPVHAFLQQSFAAALSDPVHGPSVRLRHRQLLSTTDSLKAFVASAISDLPTTPTYDFVAPMGPRIQAMFRDIHESKPSYAAPKISPETLLLRTRSMEEGPHRNKVQDKLAVVIPFQFVIPVLPFFYLMLLLVFGLSWFFHPPILEPTLKGIENAITKCTNPYNTADKTKDGVIPWDCPVGFTELGMQVETFQDTSMASFFSFVKKDTIPRNVTHLPWAYLRFATTVTYNGLKTEASSLTDADTPGGTAHKYWVLTELRKLPEWVPEIFQQKNTKANDSTISFKGETTRTFAHTIVPYQFGNHTLLGTWMAGVAALLLACVAGVVYHVLNLWSIIAEREVRLVEVSTVQRSLRGVLLLCEFAAVLFIAVGLGIMATTFDQHRADDLITRPTAMQWQRVEIFFRVGLTFCSFRAVSFFSEMPKPHHFAIVNAGVVSIGLMAVLGSLLVLPTARFGLAVSLKSLLSLQAVDALTLPVVLAVSLFLRSSKVTDEVRQAHYNNLREDLGEVEAENGAAPSSVGSPIVAAPTHDPRIERGNSPPDGEGEAGGAEPLRSGVEQSAPGSPTRLETPLRPWFRPFPTAEDTTVSVPSDASESSLSQHDVITISSQLTASDGDERSAAGSRWEQSEPFFSPDGDNRHGDILVDNEEDNKTNSSGDAVSRGMGGQSIAVGGVSDREQPPEERSSPPQANTLNLQPAEREEVKEEEEKAKEKAAAVRSRARRRWILSWAVILVAGLGQVLLYALAVTVVIRPLLTLPAPGGVLPVTGDSFLSSDDLGMVGFARRFF